MRLSPTKVKEHRIYTDGLALPQIQGTSVYTELRRAQPEQSSEAPLSGLPSAAAEFVRDALLVRPLSGSKRGTVVFDRPYMLLRAPITRYSGQAEVEVTWSLDQL